MFTLSKFVPSISVLAGVQPSAYTFFQSLTLNLRGYRCICKCRVRQCILHL